MLQKRFDRVRSSPSSVQLSAHSNPNSHSPIPPTIPSLTTIPTRRGQVTIFIILGIVALLSIILIIAIKTQVVTFKPGEIIPTEKNRIEQLITSCITNVGENAVRTLGQQGGYLTIPSQIADNANLYLQTSPVSDLPYWAYGENTLYPSLEDIKTQLDHELEQKLHNCVFELGKLDSYDVEERSPITGNTEIVESKIIFNVHWDLLVKDKNGEIVTEVANHVAESDIKLKHAYDLSRRILDVELRDLKLEDLTQDLIALEHKDLPVAGFEVSCAPKRWPLDKVKQTLKDLLRVNLAQLKVKGTNINQYPADLPYYQNHYFWNLGDDVSYGDELSVVFTFDDNYPFTFDVSPRSGNALRSNSFGQHNSLLSFFCMQSWKFTYDVSFPVVVRVHDETTGYDFKSSFTVHLHHNIPNRKDTPHQGTAVVFGTYDNDQFCQAGTVPFTFKTYQLVNNNEGVYSRTPLEGADISYNCLQYQCDAIAQTQYDFAGMGDVAATRTNVPLCGGAIVRASKDGYKEDWKRVVSNPDGEVELELIPLEAFPLSNVEIVTHQFTSSSQIGPAQKLSDDVTAFISFYYDGNMTSRDPFSSHFHDVKTIISSSLDPEISQKQELQFLAQADFTYPLEVLLLKGGISDEGGGEVIGGYKGNWTVVWNQLENTHKIVIHTLVPTDTSNTGVINLMTKLDQDSLAIPAPELIS